MQIFLENIRQKFGACPLDHSGINGDKKNQDQQENKSPLLLPGSIVSTSVDAISPESRPEFTDNVLLIVLLVAGFCFAFDLKYLFFFGIFCALVVYYDAIQLHAGLKFEKESLLGEVVAWRPITWAVFVLIGSLLSLAIYTFSRREVFNANN